MDTYNYRIFWVLHRYGAAQLPWRDKAHTSRWGFTLDTLRSLLLAFISDLATPIRPTKPTLDMGDGPHNAPESWCCTGAPDDAANGHAQRKHGMKKEKGQHNGDVHRTESTTHAEATPTTPAQIPTL